MVDTSGELSCGNERIIGAAVRSVRAVGSLYVTVLGSAAYKGARYLVRVWRGSRRDLTRHFPGARDMQETRRCLSACVLVRGAHFEHEF